MEFVRLQIGIFFSSLFLQLLSAKHPHRHEISNATQHNGRSLLPMLFVDSIENKISYKMHDISIKLFFEVSKQHISTTSTNPYDPIFKFLLLLRSTIKDCKRQNSITGPYQDFEISKGPSLQPLQDVLIRHCSIVSMNYICEVKSRNPTDASIKEKKINIHHRAHELSNLSTR